MDICAIVNTKLTKHYIMYIAIIIIVLMLTIIIIVDSMVA